MKFKQLRDSCIQHTCLVWLCTCFLKTTGLVSQQKSKSQSWDKACFYWFSHFRTICQFFMKSSLRRIFPRETTFVHSRRSQQFTLNQKCPVYYQPGSRHFKMTEGTWWLTSLVPVKAASPRKTIQSALQWFWAQENLWVFWGASVVRHCNWVCSGLARDRRFHVVII